MTCGSCKYTDGCCYTSMPPKVKCLITGKFRLYDDCCDCCDCENSLAQKQEEFDKLKELINRSEVKIDYDKLSVSDILSSEKDAEAGLIDLPLYGEADVDSDILKATEAIAIGSVPCIVCGEDIIVSMFEGYPKICQKCRRAVLFIREKFKEELMS